MLAPVGEATLPEQANLIMYRLGMRQSSSIFVNRQSARIGCELLRHCDDVAVSSAVEDRPRRNLTPLDCAENRSDPDDQRFFYYDLGAIVQSLDHLDRRS